MRIKALSVLALMAGLTLAGCEQAPRGTGEASAPGSGSGAVPASTEPVLVGVAAPLTGNSSEFGVQIRMGAELAEEQINAAGGIGGRKFELSYSDDAGNPAEAQNVATKLATNPRVMAVVGHFNSSCSLAGKRSYSEAGMVMFSPASTNVDVTKNSKWVFRNIFSDDFQGQCLADYTKLLGHTQVAILYENDDYGSGLKNSYKERAGELGLAILREVAYDQNTNDFRSQLETVRSENPEIIIIAGLYKQAAIIVTQAREIGITAPFAGGDGVFSQQFIDLGGAAAEGTYVTTPFLFDLGGTKAEEFAKGFREKYNREPDAWAALSYDAVNLVAAGLREKGVNRDAVREYLEGINSAETAYDGLAGKTFFDEEGDCRKPVQVAVVKDGKFAAAEKQLDAGEDAPAAAPAEEAAEAPAAAPAEAQ